MPAVNDIIETVLITELVGVSMSTKLLWKIDDLGTDEPVRDNITAIAAEFRDAVNVYMSTGWQVTCISYTNLSQVEAKVVAPLALFGSSIVDPHPQNQVLNIRRWGLYDVDAKVRNGRFALSGVTEDFSTRGRFTDVAECDEIEAFVGGPSDLSGGLWQITPCLKITPDWVNFPLVKAFIDVFQAEVDPAFSVNTRRRTKLCGIV
jgi:hypothetical protein